MCWWICWWSDCWAFIGWGYPMMIDSSSHGRSGWRHSMNHFLVILGWVWVHAPFILESWTYHWYTGCRYSIVDFWHWQDTASDYNEVMDPSILHEQKILVYRWSIKHMERSLYHLQSIAQPWSRFIETWWSWVSEYVCVDTYLSFCVHRLLKILRLLRPQCHVSDGVSTLSELMVHWYVISGMHTLIYVVLQVYNDKCRHYWSVVVLPDKWRVW
jgi:hypothetical protein